MTPAPTSEALPQDREMLLELGRAEATAIRHLERSNTELLAALEVDEDSDFRLAVNDNLAVLERKYVRLADIGTKLGQPVPPSRGPASAWADSSCPSASSRSRTRDSSQDMAFDIKSIGVADNDASTLSRMHTLLQQVKRKASALEADLVLGDLKALSISHGIDSRREQCGPPSKVARTESFQNSSFPACRQRGMKRLAEPLPVVSEIALCTRFDATCAFPSAATSGPSDSASCCDVDLKRLGDLLQRVKRKASELNGQAMVGVFSDEGCEPSPCRLRVSPTYSAFSPAVDYYS